MRRELVAFSFIQAGHEQCAQRLVLLGCEYGGMEGDDIGCEYGGKEVDDICVGDELGANDGTRACRRGANLRSLILPKNDGSRPRFIELDSVMISASCFSLPISS